MRYYFIGKRSHLGIAKVDESREVVIQELVLFKAFATARSFDYIWLGDDRFIVLTSDGIWIGSVGENGQRIIELSGIDWRLFKFVK